MTSSVKWSFHKYLMDREEGLRSKLDLSKEQDTFLRELRKQSRIRIREAFSEAQDVVREVYRNINGESRAIRMQNEIKTKRSFEHLDKNLLSTLTSLAINMDDRQREAFLKIKPKFRTQGSFEYKTLNVPYFKPPQEMDIDDGVYFPMQMFDDAPTLAHKLMIALVDSALYSLTLEHDGWSFDNSKATCSRVRVSNKNVHLDVPMYAVPEQQFEKMMESAKVRRKSEDSFSINESWLISDDAVLDKDSVHLARRDKDKWQKSDPQVVQRWFTESVEEVGEHLRLACRFLKAWRDANWKNGGGPSSIALMKCAVDTLGNNPSDGKDLGLVMLNVVENLHIQLSEGVESPDPSDQRPLFPDASQHQEKEHKIVKSAKVLSSRFADAVNANTKTESRNILNDIFGNRGIRAELITMLAAAKVYGTPASISEPAKINRTMKSGQ